MRIFGGGIAEACSPAYAGEHAVVEHLASGGVGPARARGEHKWQCAALGAQRDQPRTREEHTIVRPRMGVGISQRAGSTSRCLAGSAALRDQPPQAREQPVMPLI